MTVAFAHKQSFLMFGLFGHITFNVVFSCVVSQNFAEFLCTVAGLIKTPLTEKLPLAIPVNLWYIIG